MPWLLNATKLARNFELITFSEVKQGSYSAFGKDGWVEKNWPNYLFGCTVTNIWDNTIFQDSLTADLLCQFVYISYPNPTI